MRTMTDDKDRQTDLCSRFTEKATAVSAVVSHIATINDALAYCVNLCGTGPEKIIAAPGLDSSHYGLLAEHCGKNGLTCIRSGMRDHLSGVDIGFTMADIGIAETGTLVVNCPSEELRLATMLCEYHICVLPCSKIVLDAFAADQQLRTYMRRTPNYTAFITGASRTADIERVLALGVHGPLELHILLLED